MSDLDARQRGNEAASKTVNAMRAIEVDYGPYAVVKWKKADDSLRHCRGIGGGAFVQP